VVSVDSAEQDQKNKKRAIREMVVIGHGDVGRALMKIFELRT
jgi:hypothetical protein